MEQLLLETYFWYFFLYSVIGYFCEVIYCSIPAKRFVNRGFLHGPYLPVYGFGGVAIILLLAPLKNSFLLIFIFGIIITSALEYIASFLLETIFHTRLWDYSTYRFNIHGRVCLKNSFLFGLLSLVSVYLIHPLIETLLEQISPHLRTMSAFGMLIIMAIDTTASVFRLLAFTEKLGRLQRLKEILETPIQRIAQGQQLFVERLEGEISRLHEQLRRAGKRQFDAFPGMRSLKFDAQLKLLKEMIEERRAKRKEKL